MLVALLAVSCGASRKLARSGDVSAIDWGWTEIGRGAEAGSASVRLFDSSQSISVVRYQLTKFDTCIANDTGAEADSTSALVRKHGGLAGINASYFNMKELTPSTFVKVNGVCEGMTSQDEFNSRTDGLIHIRGGHKIHIEKCDTLLYEKSCARSDDAIAAGPVLLIGGKPAREAWPDSPFYTKRHPRTVFGTASNGWGYLIVIDGRSKNAAGATIPETMEIALMLGLEDAINLDGGGSSTIWTAETEVLNHPTDNRRFDHYGQRIVPNVLYIR